MTQHTYSWLPALRRPHFVHAALDGQTRHTTPGSQLRWVWSLCAEPVNPDGEELPGVARCQECLEWMHEHAPAGNDEKPPTLRTRGGPRE